MTLLLITHEPPLAARCARQLRMADGRLHEPIIAGQRRRACPESWPDEGALASPGAWPGASCAAACAALGYSLPA